MRHHVDFGFDELAEALRFTADFLGANQVHLERLTVTFGRPVRLTAVFPVAASSTVVEGFARAVRRAGKSSRTSRSAEPGSAPAIPFHWQADGAGDFRAD